MCFSFAPFLAYPVEFAHDRTGAPMAGRVVIVWILTWPSSFGAGYLIESPFAGRFFKLV